jgi:hypothetical protein
VPLDEEPEMQAQPGIFTNQRGNLKVRAFVTGRLSESQSVSPWVQIDPHSD